MDDEEAVRAKILSHALNIFKVHGFDGFSMRKLATPLGIASKTLYNYFSNKDEIYLYILIEGFDQLYRAFKSAVENVSAPHGRLAAAIQAYIDFGIENVNIYDLIFTWHKPKFNDYVDTSSEELARRELDSALRCDEFFMDLIRSCVKTEPAVTEGEIRFEMIQIWSQMHGYVANVNNTSLSYLHAEPITLKDAVIKRIIKNALYNLENLSRHIDS